MERRVNRMLLEFCESRMFSEAVHREGILGKKNASLLPRWHEQWQWEGLEWPARGKGCKGSSEEGNRKRHHATAKTSRSLSDRNDFGIESWAPELIWPMPFSMMIKGADNPALPFLGL